MTKESEIELLEQELGIQLPNIYKSLLSKEDRVIAFGLPLLGLPVSHDINSALGATKLLKMARPDLKQFVVIRVLDDRVLALDIENGNTEDAPLVEIEILNNTPPKPRKPSLQTYLTEAERSKKRTKYAFSRVKALSIKPYNHNSLKLTKKDFLREKLDFDRMIPLLKKYGFIDEGIEVIPNIEISVETLQRYFKDTESIKLSQLLKRSQADSPSYKPADWKAVRCCVHDLVVGLTAYRYEPKFNSIEIDFFIASEHPDYEPRNGTKALLSLILSESYRNGTSMQLSFTKYDDERKRSLTEVPYDLRRLFYDYNIKLKQADNGVILHEESAAIFSRLIGFSNDVAEAAGKLYNENFSLQGLCYLINKQIWSVDEASWILLNTPDAVELLTGKFLPEQRLNFSYALSFGRCAVALSKVRELFENADQNSQNEIKIAFNGELLKVSPSHPFLINCGYSEKTFQIFPGETLTILCLPRKHWFNVYEQSLADQQTIKAIEGKKVILYTEDVLNFVSSIELFERSIDDDKFAFWIIPYTAASLNEVVINKMQSARKYRL